MQKNQKITQILCEIGIFSAIGFILDELQSILFKGVFLNGGSIGFAIIVVLIIGYRRGFFSALFTGLIIGLFDLATGAYIIHPAQLILDYLISYACVSVGCLLKPIYDKSENHKALILVLATILGGITKFLSHYISGVIFWADPNQFAWGLTNFSPYLYCFIYNIAFIGPSIILTALLLVFINKKGSKLLEPKQYFLEDTHHQEKIKTSEVVVSLITISVGLFLFVYFLINYIKSYNFQQNTTSIEYSFSKDSMLIFIIGIFILVLGVISLITSIRKTFSYKLYFGTIIILSSISLIYSITRLIKMAQSNAPLTAYIIWLTVSALCLVIFILITIFIKRKKK